MKTHMPEQQIITGSVEAGNNDVEHANAVLNGLEAQVAQDKQEFASLQDILGKVQIAKREHEATKEQKDRVQGEIEVAGGAQ